MTQLKTKTKTPRKDPKRLHHPQILKLLIPEDVQKAKQKQDYDPVIGGRPSILQLFEETANPEMSPRPIYSLKAFQAEFLAQEDLTEYKAAIKLVKSWPEWQNMKKLCPLFASCVELWKEELRVLFHSRAMERAKALLDSENDSVKLSAAKWFAENGHERDRAVGRGRPSKQEIEREKRFLAKQSGETQEHMERIAQMLRKTGTDDIGGRVLTRKELEDLQTPLNDNGGTQ